MKTTSSPLYPKREAPLPTDFAALREAFLRLAATAAKARSGPELRALLLADTGAVYHSYQSIDLCDRISCVAERLMESVLEELDEDGVPT